MLTNLERRCLFDLLMVSDPWPLSEKAKQILEGLADKEAVVMGFPDWIAAYHQMLPTKV
jgi:hypothetical protein